MRSPENVKTMGHMTSKFTVCKYQTCLKVGFKMSSVWCSNASSKTWTPLLDHFVNELLIFANHPLPPTAMLFDGAVSSAMICLSVHGLLGNSAMRFLAPYPFSYLNTLIKMWSFAVNNVYCSYDCVEQRHWVNAVCCTGIQNISSSVFRDW